MTSSPSAAPEAVYDIIGDSRDAGAFLFTCEHGDRRLPAGVPASPRDRERLEEHWGWDIGAAAVVRHLVAALGGQAVLSRISRLFVDLNRPPGAESLILRAIDGVPVDFNANLSDADIGERIRCYFEPYHDAVDRVGRERAALGPPFHLVSVHSFTPVIGETERAMEVGILFDEYEDDAEGLAAALGDEGLAVALNEPYSGRGPGGLIYAVARHGHALGVRHLELELRQDLIATAAGAEDMAARLARALSAAFEPGASAPGASEVGRPA